MFRRPILFAALSVAALGLAALPAIAQSKDDSGWGRKYKTPPPSSRIEVTVVKAFNGKPIGDAHVIFHPIEGDKDKGSLEIKTNDDGKAVIDVIPIGDTVRMQIIANGYQTYGQDYKVDKAEITMEVKLKRPAPQYSTYGNNSSGSGGQKSGDSGNSSAQGNGSSGQDSGSGSNAQQAPPASDPQPK